MSKSTLRFKKEDLKRSWSKNKKANPLPNEKWKPVPELEETHEISNYGRFRCLDKIIYPVNGKRPYPRKGHLMSPHISKHPNFTVKDFTYNININVELKNETYSFSIRRLVYHCFVEPIEIHDGSNPKYFIIPKDGNGLNTYYKNLKKATKSEIELLIYKKNRIQNWFQKISHEQRSKMASKGLFKKYKVVTQYDQKGFKIASFPSLSKASQQTKISLNTISNAANGRIKTAKGFVWKFGNGPQKIDLGKSLTPKRDAYILKKSQAITQYNIQGKRIAVYISIREACRKTQFNKSTISAGLHGRLKTANGFIWKKGKGAESIKVLIKSHKVKLAQYYQNGKLINEYPSISAAAAKTGIPYHQIQMAKAGKKNYTRFIWKSI